MVPYRPCRNHVVCSGHAKRCIDGACTQATGAQHASPAAATAGDTLCNIDGLHAYLVTLRAKCCGEGRGACWPNTCSFGCADVLPAFWARCGGLLATLDPRFALGCEIVCTLGAREGLRGYCCEHWLPKAKTRTKS